MDVRNFAILLIDDLILDAKAMVITVLQHGLGNQLFQYAAGRAVADRLQTTLLLDKTRFSYIKARDLGLTQLRVRAHVLPNMLAKVFDLASGEVTGVKAMVKSSFNHFAPTIADKEKGFDMRISNVHGGCRLDGFWQSERYFSHLRTQLINEFEPRKELSRTLRKLSRKLAAENSVAVHIRRGDLIENRQYAETIGALTADYYREALARLKTDFPDARVYLFSDEPGWCERHLAGIFPMEIVSGRLTQTALEDLTVMKQCRHFVIANSTFSWWVAWLGIHPEKRVIAPAHFFRVPKVWEKDLLPESWETLENTFEPLEAGALAGSSWTTPFPS